MNKIKVKNIKLGDVLKIKHGFAFKGEFFATEGRKILITPGNFYEKGGFKYTPGKEKFYIGNFPESYICSKGDLVVAMTEQADGLLGSTALVPENDIFLHNQRIGLIDYDINKIDKNYLYYLFQTKIVRKQIKGSASGTKVKHTSPNKIYDVEATIPDLETQKKIGHCLYILEEKIELNNKINSELESMAKTIYDYWFVQFDFPNKEEKPYKSSGGEMIWSEELKRKIPIGWEVQTVANNKLASIIKPGVKKFITKTYLATGDVTGTNISKGNIVEYETRESRANMQPKINTVWFAKMKNSIKHLFLNREMEHLIDGSILSTGFCGLECTEKSFEYISSFISSKYFENIKNILSHGTTQEAVNNNDLDSIFLIIPKEDILIKYHSKMKSIYSKKSQIICENQELTNLRDWLLPVLMNGQVIIK